MGLDITSASAEEAIRELAAFAGESMTSAIERAARDQVARLRREQSTRRGIDSENLRVVREIWVENPMTREEIDDCLYDERGLPR